MILNTSPQLQMDSEGYGCTAAIITAVPIEENSVRMLFDGWERVPVPGDPQVYESVTYEAGGKDEPGDRR